MRLRVLRLESRDVPSVPTTWSQRGTGGGGALYSPAFGWTDPTQLDIASDMSNLFHSADSGATWQTVSASEIQGNHYAKVQYTSDPMVRYCLDYTTVNGSDLIRPSKSIDGGVTWTPLAGDPTGGEAFNLFVDPLNPSHVLVSDYTSVYWSSNGGASFAFRFNTTDTGSGLHVGGALFAGTSIYVGTNKGLYVSTDDGASFTPSTATGIPAGEAIVSFAGAKVGATTRLYAVTLGVGDVYAGITGADYGGYANVYSLTNSGNWIAGNTGIPATSHPFFVAAAVNDINTVYVAGGSDAGSPVVLRSTNGGANWTDQLKTAGNQNVATGWQGQGGDRGWSYGEYALGFAVAPQNSSRVLITDLGGAHLTTDSGASWAAVYVNPADRNPANAPTPTGHNYRSSGLDNTTSWSLAWASPTTMILGNSDVKGQRSTDGGQSWNFGYTGHSDNSMYRAIKHPTTGMLYAGTGTVHDMYQSTYLQDSRIDPGTGKVLFSTDGSAWQTLHSFSDPIVWVAHDPNNVNRLYASATGSTGGIWVSSNINLGAASTWTKLAAPPRTVGHAFNIVVLTDGTLVASYSGHRNAAGAFTASSGVFISTNGGTSWIDRSAAGMQYWTKDVVIDPYDASQNTWYAGVFSGWGGPPNGLGGLYRTTNRGTTWTRINALDRVTSVTVSPTNANEAYLTTETDGLWHTENLGVANPTWTRVANYPFRQPERVFFNPFNSSEVWVTSFGGGIRVGSTSQPPSVVGTQINNGAAQRSLITSLRVTFSTTVTLTGNALTLTGPTGPVAYTMTDASTPTATVKVLTFASLADGSYSLTLPAILVTDGGGQHLATDYQAGFQRKFGDSDGDGDVDNADFVAFRTAFGAGPSLIFDADGDGDVDNADFTAFRLRFGT